MSEEQSEAGRYRREAAEIRRAAEIVRDERFQEQLLSIADEYEVLATSIEAEHSRQRKPDQGHDSDEYDGDNQGDKPPCGIGRNVDRNLEHAGHRLRIINTAPTADALARREDWRGFCGGDVSPRHKFRPKPGRTFLKQRSRDLWPETGWLPEASEEREAKR
jgi:hypothetical protein